MDQKLKKDAGKLRYDLIPPEVDTALAEIYTFGLEKGYNEESWRNVDIKRYEASFMRHFNAWRRDNTGVDEESGHEHAKHLLWNAVALYMKSCVIKDNKPFLDYCHKCKYNDSKDDMYCYNCDGISNFISVVK